LEIYCQCPIEICEQRDVKGLYKKARAGEIPFFTGIDSPYEAPVRPELVINTCDVSLEDSVQEVLILLIKHGVILG
jgi:adenylylsulfate kinase